MFISLILLTRPVNIDTQYPALPKKRGWLTVLANSLRDVIFAAFLKSSVSKIGSKKALSLIVAIISWPSVEALR